MKPIPTKWASLPFLRYAAEDETHSACPQCGDSDHKGNDKPDRFVIRLDDPVRGFCRRCGFFAFADSNFKPTVQDHQRWIQQEKERQERKRRQAERALVILADRERQILEWARMEEQQRAWWQAQGIPPSWQEYLRLGFMPDKTYNHDGTLHHSPAYVIPYYHTPQFVLQTVQYRLTQPVQESDKYRFEHGTSSCYYDTAPTEPLTEQVVICEGAKKAIVTRVNIWQTGDKTSVYAIPSKVDSAGIIEHVADCGRVYVCLDPDAYDWSIRLAQAIGKQARIVTMCCKIDDAFVSYGMTCTDWNRYLREATTV